MNNKTIQDVSDEIREELERILQIDENNRTPDEWLFLKLAYPVVKGNEKVN